ncbi:MAG: hypothetical protein AVDCRST_MAG47-55 [uncultured Nocardioidaceae bacterium]|uniref:Sulfotransferase domain-containing protein n=1 Tax=uncultured Nocardioidaceae bacterium TaxID=253824 RepID=A0A6J4MH96_9ACTN|nr:MAG: hypothetical protein AVDCRST_MAG47-55 [uncultured Nocardioidaceae bacterium]
MTLRSDTGRPVVYLHIGAMKTGTTYLQELVYANREQLAAAGLLVPGETWGRQVRGVQDVMRLGRTDRHIRRMSKGAWQELLDDACSSPDNVSLISVEFFSFAGRRKVRHIMKTLEGFDVRVILTVRNMASALPSQWQTLVHNGGRWTWEEFLDALPQPVVRPFPFLGRVRPLEGEFHRTQNVPRMLTTWAPYLAPGSLHVVTVPRRRERPGELWQRIATVIGVDPAAITHPAEGTNPSLGHASSELVRRLNTRLGRLPQSEYNWTVKEPVALEVLAKRASEEGKAQLTRAAYDLALRWNALTREVIEQTGAQVCGELSDLPTEPDPALRASLPEVPGSPRTPVILDAAEEAAATFARHARRRRRKLARAGVSVELVERPPQEELRSLWESSEDPLDAAARDLADRAREDAQLLRRIRDERHRGAAV